MKIKESIKPRLALQFVNSHYVRHFRQWDSGRKKNLEGKVEIRILDYEIDRTSGASLPYSPSLTDQMFNN